MLLSEGAQEFPEGLGFWYLGKLYLIETDQAWRSSA